MTELTSAPKPKKPKKVKEEELTELYPFSGTKQEMEQAIYSKWYGCRRCGLCDHRLTRQGAPIEDICLSAGTPDASVMFIGEAPGQEEADSGSPFVGVSGKLLNKMLANLSDDQTIKDLWNWYQRSPVGVARDNQFNDLVQAWRDQNYFLTNIVACQPPENRQPTKNEAEACWERLLNQIYLVDPIVIVAVGKVALETLLGKKAEITKVRGQLMDVEFQGRIGKVRYPLVPILHPSYLLRKADWGVKGGDYEKTMKDITTALRIADHLKNRYYGTPIPKRAL